MGQVHTHTHTARGRGCTWLCTDLTHCVLGLHFPSEPPIPLLGDYTNIDARLKKALTRFVTLASCLSLTPCSLQQDGVWKPEKITSTLRNDYKTFVEICQLCLDTQPTCVVDRMFLTDVLFSVSLQLHRRCGTTWTELSRLVQEPKPKLTAPRKSSGTSRPPLPRLLLHILHLSHHKTDETRTAGQRPPSAVFTRQKVKDFQNDKKLF